MSPASRILIAGHAIAFYIYSLLAPFNLSFIYPHWNLDPASLVQWLFPAAVLLALVEGDEQMDRARQPERHHVGVLGGDLFIRRELCDSRERFRGPARQEAVR